MGFKEFLFSHFPHRWLNIKKEGTDKLFTGLGNIFDYIENYVNIPVRNNRTRDAVEALSELENEYGLTVNPNADIDLRRTKIIVKKRMQDGCITKPQLIKMLEAFGIKVDIINYYNESIMEIRIISTSGFFYFKDIIEILDDNIRAHVGFYMEIQSECYINDFYSGSFTHEFRYYEVFPSIIGDSSHNLNRYTGIFAEEQRIYNIYSPVIGCSNATITDYTGITMDVSSCTEIYTKGKELN